MGKIESRTYAANPSGGSSITVPLTTTDNAIVRWDGTGGTAIQDSGITVGDIGSNKIIISTPSAATSTILELYAGSNSGSSIGGNLILRPGLGGSGSAERGEVVIGGTGNTAGNRVCFINESDGDAWYGWSWQLGGYRRARSFYCKSGIEMRNSGGSGAGITMSQDGTASGMVFYQSSAGRGYSIQSIYNKVLSFYDEGGTLVFNMGRWDGSGSNFGEFWLMKSTGAHLKVETDGAGDCGGATDDRFNNIYAKAGFGVNLSGSLGASVLAKFESTSKGVVLPSPSTDGSIATPEEAMIIYDNTAKKIKVYTGAGWETVTSS